MKVDVLVSGYVSLDRIVKIAQNAVVGKTSIVQNQTNSDIYYGGCPVNIAYLLARLGMAARPLLRVGSDYASTGLKAFLEDAGVNTEGIVELAEDRTSNCYLLESEEGDHITLYYPGAQDKKHFRPLDMNAFTGAKLAVLTVGAEPDNAEFLRRCRELDMPLAFGMKSDFEAFPPDLLQEILAYAEIVFMNESEAEDIKGLFGLKTIEDLFRSDKLQYLIVTEGKRGSKYWQRTAEGLNSGHVGIVPALEVVDTTGSGDAYISGFVYGYLNGYTVEESCMLGSTMASFIVEKMGCCTNAPTKENLLKRYKENCHD